MNPPDCDYIVVGAGAAGCGVAGRLSEDPSNEVTLLEAGGPDSNPLLRIPGLGFTVLGSKYNWIFETEPVPSLNNRVLKVNYGRVLGGSSSINGMHFTRGNSHEYDAWNCDGWRFADLLPYFKKLETNARGESNWHGGSGPVRTRRADPRLPVCDAFLAAASEAGHAILDDLNVDSLLGFGYGDVNIHRGKRVSAATAYLRPARARKNFRVETDAQALRVLFENGRACGVEYVQGGQVKTIRCRREVVLSAGAIKSPHLLMLSGIGPAQDLKEFGIPVVVDSPRVGGNLQNHLSYNMLYSTYGDVTNYRYLKPQHAIKAGLEYILFRKGGLAEAVGAISGFFKSDPSLDVPDAHVIFLTATIIGSLTVATAGRKMRFWDLLPKQDGFCGAVHPTCYSRGNVRLRSADPIDYPRITPNYFDDPRDMPGMISSIRIVREIVNGMGSMIKAELSPGPGVVTDAEIEEAVRQKMGHSFHPCGTCAMGSDEQTVVDTRLRVRGVEGLRVADASIIPTILNSGLHAPSLMIGERAAALIREG